MTQGKSFKRAVRERMAQTGETYTAARTAILQQRANDKASGASLAINGRPIDSMSDAEWNELGVEVRRTQ